ncbi:hypothetical protein HKD37_08G020712 [Glycine soja]
MIKYIRNYNVNDIFYNKLNPSGGHHYQILVDKDENYQCNVVYNKDLDQPVIVVGWTSLRDFYLLTEDHLVSLIHYGNSAFFSYHIQYQLPGQIISKMTFFISSSVRFCHLQSLSHLAENNLTFQVACIIFLKDKGWIHLHFEDVAKCPLVFNHLRKTLKIEVR